LFALAAFYFAFTDDLVGSKPCYPSDPTGNNPQNPCLSYPPAGIDSNSFIKGVALPVIQTPTKLSPTGREIVNPNGFWTNSDVSGKTRLLKTSNGEEYVVPK
jgi:hypothetical protein